MINCKKIFVLGCSFSHHDMSTEAYSTWPAYIAKDNPEYFVVNGSIPGSSNDSYFYRYRQMCKVYGNPDLVLVQLTSLERMYHPVVKNHHDMIEFELLTENYAHHANAGIRNIHEHLFLTSGTFWSNNKKEMCQQMQVSEKSFDDYLSSMFNNKHYLEMLTEKDLLLLKHRIKAPALYFTWEDYLTPQLLDIASSRYSAKCQLLDPIVSQFTPKQLTKYCADRYHHFNEYGHRAVADILDRAVKGFIK